MTRTAVAHPTTRSVPTIWLVLGVVVLLASAPAEVMAQSVHREVLESGTVLVVREHRLTHATAIRVLVRAAPAREGDLLGTGASLVLQELVAARLRAALVHVPGRRLYAETHVGSTAYAVTTTDAHLAEALAAIGATLADDSWDDDSFNQAKERVLRQLSAVESAPQSLLTASLFRTHPARLPVAGVRPLVESLDATAVRGWQRRAYTAPNVVVVVVGNAPVEAVRSNAETAMAALPRGGWDLPAPASEPRQLGQRSIATVGAVDRERHLHAWHLPDPASRDGAVMRVIAALLDHPRHSPLRLELAEQTPVANLAVDLIQEPDVPPYLVIGFDPLGDQTGDPATVLGRVLETLASEGPESSALAAAKRTMGMADRVALQSAAGIAAELGDWELAIGLPSHGDAVRLASSAVDAEAIKRVVGSWLRPNGRNRVKLVVRPPTTDGDAPIDGGLPITDVPPRVEGLANGMRLVHRFVPTGLAQVRVTIGGGHAADDAGSGAARVLAAVLSNGSQTRQGDDFRSQLDAAGMLFSSRSTVHAIHLDITCFPEDVEGALALLLEVAARPALDETSVAAAVSRLQADTATLPDASWHGQLAAAARDTLLADHYAAASRNWTRQSLTELTADDVRALHQRLTVSGNVVVGVYGSFDATALVPRLRDALSGPEALVSGEPVQPVGEPWPTEPPPALTSTTWERDEAGVSLVWRGPALGQPDDDGVALDVLTALLVNSGVAGRLHQSLAAAEIELREPLAVDVEAYLGRGLWMLHMLVAKDQVDNAREALREAVGDVVAEIAQQAGLASEGAEVASPELIAARELCITRRRLQQEDQRQVAEANAESVLISGGIEADSTYANRVAAVTVLDLHRVAQRYLAGDPAVIRIAPPAPVEAAQPTDQDEPAAEGDTIPKSPAPTAE